MFSRLFPVFFFVGLGFLLTQLSSGIVFPALPVGVDFFSTTSMHMKSAVSYYFSGYAVGQLLWGTLSDRFGRRYMCLLALMVYMMAAIMIVLTSELMTYFLLYALIGFGAAAFTSVGNAILKDLFGPTKVAKAIGVIGIVMACGPTLGAALGTPMSHQFGWVSIYVFLLALSGFIFFGFIAVVPETSQPLKGQLTVSTWEKAIYIFQQRAFLRSILVLGASFGAVGGFLDAGAFLFSGYAKLSTAVAGWCLMVCSSGYILGALLVPLLIQRWGIYRLMVAGVLLFFLSLLSLVVINAWQMTQMAGLLSAFFVCLMGLGMLVPLGKAGCMTSNSQYAGMTSSMMKFIQTIFVVSTTVVVSVINTSTSILPLLILLGVCLLIALSGLLIVDRSVSDMWRQRLG